MGKFVKQLKSQGKSDDSVVTRSQKKVLQTLQQSKNDVNAGSVSEAPTTKNKICIEKGKKVTSSRTDNLSVRTKIIQVVGKENSPKKLKRSCRNKILDGANAEETNARKSKRVLDPESDGHTSKSPKSLINCNKRKAKVAISVNNASCQPKVNLESDLKQEEFQISEGYEYLITDVVPLPYWKEVAEQHQAVLELTLRENESLHDEIAVLQAENENLKSVVKSAECLASFLLKNLPDDDNDELQLLEEEKNLLLNSS